MKTCIACGMPLAKEEDIGAEIKEGLLCKHCVDENGNILSCQEIFDGGVEFFMTLTDNNRELAEKVTRKNISMQPYWQGKDQECLKGEKVSDEEFQNILAKLNM